jgi:hypothetical protein
MTKDSNQAMMPSGCLLRMGLEVTIDLTVLYKLLPSEAPKFVKETGEDYRDKIVRPLTRTKIRINAVYYEAISLYSGKGMSFNNAFLKV